MIWLSEGKLFVNEGDLYRNVGVTAKDKVVTHLEPESVSIVPGEVVVDSLAEAVPLTLDEVISKFQISEANPVVPMQASKPETTKARSKKK